MLCKKKKKKKKAIIEITVYCKGVGYASLWICVSWVDGELCTYFG